MNNLSRRLLLIVCISVLVQAPWWAPAHAFSLLGNADLSDPPRWSEASLFGGLTYAIEPNFDQISTGESDPSAAVRNAFGTWEQASDALSFTESSFVFLSPYYGANIDVFSMPSTFTYGGFSLEGSLALALVGTYQGDILGVDIFINSDYTWSDNPGGDEFDIESVALHEIGHALGLGHPDLADDFGLNFDSSGSAIAATGDEVMNSTIAVAEISRALTSDEIAGLDFLYPFSGEGSGGILVGVADPINNETVPEPSTLILFGSGFAALLALRRRRIVTPL